jgi:hypothetical protein
LEGDASNNGGGRRSGGSAARDTRTCQNMDSYIELVTKCFYGGKSRRLMIFEEIKSGNYMAASNHNVEWPNLHHPLQIAEWIVD